MLPEIQRDERRLSALTPRISQSFLLKNGVPGYFIYQVSLQKLLEKSIEVVRQAQWWLWFVGIAGGTLGD